MYMNSLYGGLDDTHPFYDPLYDTHPFYDPLYDSYHPLSEGLISETEGSAERLNLTGENNNVLEGQQEDSETLAGIERKKTGERPVTSEEEPEYKKRRIEN